MKKGLIVLCLSCISFLAQTQVTRSDFKSLIPSIEKEGWKYVFKRSGALLEANPTDSSEMHAMMVYIRLFSGAGLVNQGKMSYKKLKEEVMPLVEQNILMAAHPLIKKEGALNTTSFSKEGQQWKVFSATANESGTNIL